ncbi:MAG: CDP-diacylglycerol--serine O-phosphatidyltransferase [Candidatus Micrarchaeia archaeon]
MALFTPKLRWVKLKDYFTLANALAGFLAVLLFLRGEREAGMLLVVLAVALDFLDGKVARLIGKNSSNDFGRELDSLADTVSFAVAPAALIVADHGFVVIPLAIAVFFLSAGVVRLAIFNLQTKSEKGSYTGMAIPIAALLVVFVHAFAFPYSLWVSLLAGFAMLLNFKYSKKVLKKATGLPLVFD